MSQEQLIKDILGSKMFSQWHWLSYHFQLLHQGIHSPLSEDLLVKLELIENKIPGFGRETVDRIAAISGQQSHVPHYEQLLQLLAEIIVFAKLALQFSTSDFSFEWEPTSGTSRKNPELRIDSPEWSALIEVKCPSLIKHLQNSRSGGIQLPARISDNPEALSRFSSSGQVIKPLDNKIKDFLVGAEGKFGTFAANEVQPFSLLVVAWDRFLFEAVSPLVNGMSGLFTENSFYRDSSDSPIRFPSVSGVLVTEHLEVALRGTREEALPDGFRSPLDYGDSECQGTVSPVFLPNPCARSYDIMAKEAIVKALNGERLTEVSDPRVQPLDSVFWF